MTKKNAGNSNRKVAASLYV